MRMGGYAAERTGPKRLQRILIAPATPRRVVVFGRQGGRPGGGSCSSPAGRRGWVGACS